MALVIFFELPNNIKIIRLKQYPLPDQKTWTAQRYVYGVNATWRAYMQILMIPLLIALTVWSYFQLEKLISTLDHNKLQQERALQCQISKP